MIRVTALCSALLALALAAPAAAQDEAEEANFSGIFQVDGCISPCGAAPRSYDLGFSVGGGTFITVTDYAGFRADARYFFSPADHPELRRPDDVKFWRVSVGATFMWSILP